MRISPIAVVAFTGLADAASISGEKIQHHMNKLDKLKLLSRSERVAKGRKLAYDYENYNQQQAEDEYDANGQYYQSQQGENSYYFNNNQNQNSNGNNNNNQGSSSSSSNNQQGSYSYSNYNQYSNQDEASKIDGSYTLQFEQCVSLGVLNQEIDEYVGKNLKSTEDYVIFKAIDRYGRSTEYATKIATFVDTMINTIPNDRSQYCQACEDYRETCEYKGYVQQRQGDTESNNMQKYGSYYDDDTNAQSYYQNGEDTAAENENEGGNRRLEKESDSDTIHVTCDNCLNYGCWEEFYGEQQQAYQRLYEGWDDYISEGDDMINMDTALEWLTRIGQCQEVNLYVESNQYSQTQSENKWYQGNNENMRTYYQYQNSNPYASLMCNKDGSGMEIGVFLDPECTIYDSARNFKSILKETSAQYQFYRMTKGMVEWMFTQPIDCRQVSYDYLTDSEEYEMYQNEQQEQAAQAQYGDGTDNNSYQYGNYNDENSNQYQEEEEDIEAIQTCQQLFQEEIVQIDAASCTDDDDEEEAAYNNRYGNYNYNGNGNGNYVDDSKQYGKYTYYREQVGWDSYFYDLKDSDDTEQVCSAMQTKETLDNFETVNSQKYSANMYNYKMYSAKVSWGKYKDQMKESFGAYEDELREDYQVWYNNKGIPYANSAKDKIMAIEWDNIATAILLAVVAILLLVMTVKVARRFRSRLAYYKEQEAAREQRKTNEGGSEISSTSGSDDSNTAALVVGNDNDSYNFFPKEETFCLEKAKSKDPPIEPSKFEMVQSPQYPQPYEYQYGHTDDPSIPYEQPYQVYQQPSQMSRYTTFTQQSNVAYQAPHNYQ